MAKKPVFQPYHTMGTVTTATALMEDSSIFDSLQKDLVEDLKRMRVEIKKKNHQQALKERFAVRIIERPPNRNAELKPFGGKYILINLGLFGLDFGFMAQPVINALRMRFESNYRQKYREGPYLLSGPNYNEFYKTPWGIFTISYDMNSGWSLGQKI
jgi:hypothetical protein